MEIMPGLAPAARAGPILAELSNHQLSQRVIQIGGIVGAPRGLLPRIAGILEGLLPKKPLRCATDIPFV